MNVLNEIKTLLGMDIRLAQMKLVDGVTVLESESFEAGQQVFVVGENGDLTPAPIGEHELEDQKMVLVITEEGIIAEIKEKVEEVEEEQDVEAKKEDEDLEMSKEAQVAELLKSIVAAMSIEMAKQIEGMRTELKAEIAEAKEIQLSASTKAKPEVKSNQPLTNFEKFRNFNKQFN